MNLKEMKKAIEAMVFASDEPISGSRIVNHLENGATEKTIQNVINILNEEYHYQNRVFRIIEIAGGYQMMTTPDTAEWVGKLLKSQIKSRLSQAALETISIIAYKQPISRVGIEAIRGVNAGGVLKTLLERNLITIAGRENAPGRPLIYKTTQEFLKYFGLNKIVDLPKLEELKEMTEEA